MLFRSWKGDSVKSLQIGLFLSIISGAGASAQDFRATIIGQVTDPSHAAVPHALVKVTRADNNQSTEVRTNGDGVYSIPFLNPGIYSLEVSAPGFATLKQGS